MNLEDALIDERYGNNTWWTHKTPPPAAETDNDLATARRRRELDAEMHEKRRAS